MKNYSQIEKEGLAIIYAITKVSQVHTWQIIYVTNRPLLAIFGSEKGIPSNTTNRLQGWSIILLNYNSKMVYISSKIAHADGLSRLIPKSSELLEETVIALLKEKELSEILVNTIRELLK